jgi:hypothetical protein
MIYFLLTAYIDTARSSGKLASVPEHIIQLPLRGVADVRTRFESLLIELDVASKQLNDEACVGIREALHIFGAALNGVRLLEAGAAGKLLSARRDGTFIAPVPERRNGADA